MCFNVCLLAALSLVHQQNKIEWQTAGNILPGFVQSLSRTEVWGHNAYVCHLFIQFTTTYFLPNKTLYDGACPFRQSLCEVCVSAPSLLMIKSDT